MADTHINAFFGDVDEKQRAFEQAAADLQVAKNRLEIKKKQVGYVEPVVTKDEPVVEDPKPNTGAVFTKKK